MISSSQLTVSIPNSIGRSFLVAYKRIPEFSTMSIKKANKIVIEIKNGIKIKIDYFDLIGDFRSAFE